MTPRESGRRIYASRIYANKKLAAIVLAVVVVVVTLASQTLTSQTTQGTAAPAVPPPPSLQECLSKIHHPCLTPALMRAVYGVDALLRRGITGRGRTIAIVDSFGSPTIRADLHAFDAAFGLPDPQLQILAPLGVRHPRNTGWVGETTLDVEWAHAIAPGARLVLLESPVDETEGVQGMPQFLTLERYAVQHHLADVVSQSWDATEDTLFDARGRALVASFHRFYADATKKGVTFVAASGDDGTGGLDLSLKRQYPYPTVQYPASDPNVLAVGGTRLVVDASGRLLGETAWSGSGGGLSKLFPEPSYQRSLPSSVQRLLGGRRGLPDVAYDAAAESPVLIYQGGRWGLTGGTSAAAPQWAALVALADDVAGRDLGLVNARLYQLGATARYHADFRDITAGSITGPARDKATGRALPQNARPGWDFATGLGSPRATTLVPDLGGGRKAKGGGK